MSEFTIRSESVDVEQIMKQIRQRILEKRGQDYTEDQIRELASVRLEKFLDPKNLRSDLLEQFRKSRPAVEPADIQPPKIQPPYTFDDQTLFASHRGLMRFLRKLLNPFLKLMFNPNTLNQVLHTQAQFNVDLLKREARRSVEQRQLERSRGEWNALYYEVLHNIVLETTRMGIEVQNLRMKVESLSSRLDFSERRVRALEGVVQYRPEVVRSADRREEREPDHAASATAAPGAAVAGGSPGGIEGFVPSEGAARRRRRRRRGRRGSQGASGAMGAPGAMGGGLPSDQGGQESEGFDGGDDADDMDEASAGFDLPEPAESRGFDRAEEPEAPRAPDAVQSPQTPQASEASAFAPEGGAELRRETPDSGSGDDQQ
ncbi:MAG TPA: hypothetical protein VEA16_22310 [Vicinamibacterales bacterium]|nr:hypothetical protein [Vicinamibacterales bacterium]